jgi:peptidoglycan-N-acetylglucosamine deacetylase
VRGRRIARIAAVVIGVAIVFVGVVAGLRQVARSRTFQLFGELVSHVDTRDSIVALTFDDGPVAGVADTLISVLGARGVHATFFVIGQDLAAAPDVGRALVAAGHELGNHTYTHPHMVMVTPSTVRREVEDTDSLIRAAGEHGPIRFRPPFGYKLFGLPLFLARTHRTSVTWDIEPDSYPGVAATPQGIVSYVLARVRPGSIILLHPWYRSRATSLAAVPLLVDSLHARGYRVATVGELIGEP